MKMAVNLQEFWQKLVIYTETVDHTERAVKNLLAFLLQGSPYRTFYANKDKSIQDICTILIERFGHVSTIQDKIKELEDITRKDKERISGTMSRVAELLDATQLLVKESDRKVRFEILMTNYLLKLATPKAKQAMLNHRGKSLRSGYVVTYKELLSVAMDIERQENESDTDLYAFPVVRAKNYRSHREKPYDINKPPAYSTQSLPPNPGSAGAPSNSKPNNSSNQKPFNQRYGNEFKNINDHYKNNSNVNRGSYSNQKDFKPAYDYNDSYQSNYHNRQWENNYSRNYRPNYGNFKPKIYQGYGNYAKHKYPPYPMGCGACGLYHYGRCPSNNRYQKYDYNRNNKNDLN